MKGVNYGNYILMFNYCDNRIIYSADPVNMRHIKERMNYDNTLRRRNGTYH